ncbi:MAG TPA: peptidoglycan editing factor PgeF [Roseateles sp.]|nr:peptidoglycan editing factor PgeF [Roseateles sp.]
MAALHEDWLRPDWDASRAHAFMTTRAGGVSAGPYASLNVGRAVGDDPAAVAENRARVEAALGVPAVFLRQVHGNEVLRLRPEQRSDDAPAADAAISTDPGLGVAIQVADCLPVLFAAPGAVGGAHAGWRGLAGGVLKNTVAALRAATGCRAGEIQAWLGACIGPAAFEVGEDVLQACGGDPACYVYRPNARGEPRWRADLPALARARLAAAGLQRIGGGQWCTFSEPSRFFSFRREPLDGHPSGRMVAAIRLL